MNDKTRPTSITDFYIAKAAATGEKGVTLEADDLAILDDLQRTSDDIAALDHVLSEGRTLTTQSGSVKIHPALAAVRQLRVTRARLAAVMDARILAACSNSGAASGGQTGIRGVYTGNGSQNQGRDNERGARRGKGRVARPRAGRGA